MAGRSEPGITPACAGKSHWRLWRTGSDWDHPRMCGEKCPMCQWRRSLKGSPPHVRGKDGPRVYYIPNSGITPAYAGKSTVQRGCSRHIRDHPRVCGEKYYVTVGKADHEGSPPRMRGKAKTSQKGLWGPRITPAYAGKSGPCPDRVPPAGDHPRVCGEKSQSTSASPRALGSPPRMRGKGVKQSNSRIRMGITPAYAGKSCIYRSTTSISWDHPRVCGEKSFKTSTSCWSKGSPPRMRGKGIQPCNQWVRVGITPAYAGKRYEEMLQQAGR